LKKGIIRIQKELLISDKKILEIVISLVSDRHVLLAGPVGTGKTRLSQLIPLVFWPDGGYFSEVHTATADWTTQDVIGGIIPKMENRRPVYDIQNGCVTDSVSKNWEDGIKGGLRKSYWDGTQYYRGVWLVIDEFNRADIDKAFGQLFTALRNRDLKIPTEEIGKAYRDLSIPQDYRIIGTLNTADKHHLFHLSDALKSRFAYIEIDIPKKSERETEIYYALQNAVEDLDFDFAELLVLDDEHKKILEKSISNELLEAINFAYDFLDFIRNFKKLGTSLLKSMYQTILIGWKMTENHQAVLDSALNSNLMPQIENLPGDGIKSTKYFFFGNFVDEFLNIYKGQRREGYSNGFGKTLQYLGIQDYEALVRNFSIGNLSDNDWQRIRKEYTAHKEKLPKLNLELLKNSLDDLDEKSVF